MEVFRNILRVTVQPPYVTLTLNAVKGKGLRDSSLSLS